MMYNNKKTEKMKTEKKTYEKPTVQKVEFDFQTRIAASKCTGVVYDSDNSWGCSFSV